MEGRRGHPVRVHLRGQRAFRELQPGGEMTSDAWTRMRDGAARLGVSLDDVAFDKLGRYLEARREPARLP